jgi:hypothetical protein
MVISQKQTGQLRPALIRLHPYGQLLQIRRIVVRLRFQDSEDSF